MHPTHVKYPAYIKMPCPFCDITADVIVLSNTDYSYPDGWKTIPIFCSDFLHPTKGLCLPIFSCPACNKRKEAGEELQITAEFQDKLTKGKKAVQAAIRGLRNLERESDSICF